MLDIPCFALCARQTVHSLQKCRDNRSDAWSANMISYGLFDVVSHIPALNSVYSIFQLRDMGCQRTFQVFKSISVDMKIQKNAIPIENTQSVVSWEMVQHIAFLLTKCFRVFYGKFLKHQVLSQCMQIIIEVWSDLWELSALSVCCTYLSTCNQC